MSNIIIKVTTAQMEKMKQAYLSYLLPKKNSLYRICC